MQIFFPEEQIAVATHADESCVPLFFGAGLTQLKS